MIELEPDILMFLNNRVELNGSLLQFKHKASFIRNDDIIYPPTDKFKGSISFLIIYSVYFTF